jgi:transcriptional regulator with XRE-family HTH domain
MDIKKLRLQRAWSQEQLAECSGISVRTIQRLEKGGQMSLESRKAIAAAFDLDTSEFSKNDKQKTPEVLTHSEQTIHREVKNLKKFYKKLIRYGLTMLFLLIINLLNSPDHFWVIWPALGWGIHIAWEGLQIYGNITVFGPAWEERQIKKRLNK